MILLRPEHSSIENYFSRVRGGGSEHKLVALESLSPCWLLHEALYACLLFLPLPLARLDEEGATLGMHVSLSLPRLEGEGGAGGRGGTQSSTFLPWRRLHT